METHSVTHLVKGNRYKVSKYSNCTGIFVGIWENTAWFEKLSMPNEFAMSDNGYTGFYGVDDFGEPV